MTEPPVAIYYEVSDLETDMAAGAPVVSVTETTGEIGELELAGGKVASAVYTGPYNGMPDAWNKFMKAILAQGEKTVEPCWEEYLADPSNEPDDTKWRTLMVQPLV